jgi:hypothetical protein
MKKTELKLKSSHKQVLLFPVEQQGAHRHAANLLRARQGICVPCQWC